MEVEIIPISPPNGAGRTNPLNPLSKTIRKHLSDSLTRAIADSTISSIVLYGGKNFSAGADIS